MVTEAAPIPVEPGISLALARHRAASLSQIRYQLSFTIPAALEEDISASAAIVFELAATDQDLQLDFRGDAAAISRLTVNHAAAAWRYEAEHITVPGALLRAGRNRLEIEFTAGACSLNRNPEYLHTLFVPDRARTAFPLFDQPDLKARYDLTLELPPGWTALANSRLLKREHVDCGERYRFATTEPISSYLFSFVAGRFEAVTREIDGRSMTLLHRETDADKAARNLDAIFDLHGQAIDWLERYTGIPYPFAKLDFALIPGFPYGGMEHVGAIQYRANRLLLDESPSDTQLLDRASLIAHEVAHMWFGNLVTVRWFNDVWTKEVFANFMAAKIVNPAFPAIDHELNFLVRHHPGAYSVDRTVGANPIRQDLDNLNQAGQMYGPIIYYKAPIMMRQLELLLGEEYFRAGIREYLSAHAYGNASWPDLIAILDRGTDTDLYDWSRVWVETAGRPQFLLRSTAAGRPVLEQHDPAGNGRSWPQQFTASTATGDGITVRFLTASTQLPAPPILFNSNGTGYGLFPADPANLARWSQLPDLQRGALLIDLYENLLQGNPDPLEYAQDLLALLPQERSQLVQGLALDQLTVIYPRLLRAEQQAALRPALEDTLWQATLVAHDPGAVRQLYETYSVLASSPGAVAKLHDIWRGKLELPTLALSETDRIRLAETLTIGLPGEAEALLEKQFQQIENPDNRRRLQFIAPSLSPHPSVRDAFFDSLHEDSNRQTEPWVLDALGHLHHPSRTAHSERYLGAALELLEEIQVTGDVFFPSRWLQANLQNHHTDSALETIDTFLKARPRYNTQLRMKILQAVDMPRRANRIRQAGESR